MDTDRALVFKKATCREIINRVRLKDRGIRERKSAGWVNRHEKETTDAPLTNPIKTIIMMTLAVTHGDDLMFHDHNDEPERHHYREIVI